MLRACNGDDEACIREVNELRTTPLYVATRVPSLRVSLTTVFLNSLYMSLCSIREAQDDLRSYLGPHVVTDVLTPWTTRSGPRLLGGRAEICISIRCCCIYHPPISHEPRPGDRHSINAANSALGSTLGTAPRATACIFDMNNTGVAGIQALDALTKISWTGYKVLNLSCSLNKDTSPITVHQYDPYLRVLIDAGFIVVTSAGNDSRLTP